LWESLDRWAKGESAGGGSRRGVTHAAFGRALAALADVPARARTPRGGRVRILSAGRAAGLACDHLFLTGLGEGSWPDLSAPRSLLDDPERERLRRAGLPLADPAARLGAEQLLFLELASAPRVGLTLSYPAVDEQGQPLLPSSFLREVQACFEPNSIPTTRQRMPIEGYLTCNPLSAAEARVQAAATLARRPTDGRPWACETLPPDLCDNLRAAQQAADARFRARTFGPFDGDLRHPAVIAELNRRFGPERVFSPTSLEAYVACPFRFWLEHVLRLEPLEDPAEDVEHTRRGSAFHRALARFHRWIRDTLPQPPDPTNLPDDLPRRVQEAAEEYARRAPSVANRELWRLEGQRLMRSAARYRAHWEAFRDPWRENKAAPVPHSFEADFGVPGEPGVPVPDPLVIRVGDVEVRVGGRIDRVDVAEVGGELGFWVIDYKTGRAANYSAAQVERFEKLQLPLYAVAVERVLLKDRPARPLGLAYWLVTDTGPKPMLPSGRKQLLAWFADPARWPKFRSQLEAWVATLATHVRAGDFPLAPRSDHCTDTCPFGPVCRIAQSRNTGKVFPLGLPPAE
jgi:ATP-dependent helicase/DNAse subunit B